jgi:TfoX/Sxy family transcriptional regulator of competence genes
MPNKKTAKKVKGAKSAENTKSAKKTPRKMPAFTKPTEETRAAFERATDGLPGIERRTMFGYPSVFLNGNMLASIFQDRIMVRLSEPDRGEAMQRAGAKPFEPTPGRGMKEYVELPSGVIADAKALRGWLERGIAYVRRLPSKAAKNRQ